jgi:hypothetical protein
MLPTEDELNQMSVRSEEAGSGTEVLTVVGVAKTGNEKER